MPSRKPWAYAEGLRGTLLLAALVLASWTIHASVDARPWRSTVRWHVETDARVILVSPPTGPITPPTIGAHPGSQGGTLVADAHGLLVVERSAGAVIRCDLDGAPVARVELRPGLGELVSDGDRLAFVADRAADRIVQLTPGDAAGNGLAIAREVAVVEPHGLALTPDGSLLLATSVADQKLVAIDTATLAIRWQVELAAEPRGVAITRAGQAVVGFLTSGSLAFVDLAARGQRVRWRSQSPRDQVSVSANPDGGDFGEGEFKSEIREARSRFQVPSGTGRRYARANFTVAVIGGDRVVALDQVATPQLVRRPSVDNGTYGGVVDVPPIEHRVGFFDPGDTMFATIVLHQPRAVVHDLAHDLLYVGGHGDDGVVAIAEASQQAPHSLWIADLAARGPCGIDGLALVGERLWVHCELSHRLLGLDRERLAEAPTTWTTGPILATDPRSPRVARGAELFRRGGDVRISGSGVMACASCHPEGRADGLSWRLGPSVLQTPMLAGRVVDTAPFKWDGQDRDLPGSIVHTLERLGDQSEFMEKDELAALRAFLEALPRPRARTADLAVAARGQQLFADLGCADCHAGPSLTDRAQHPFKGPLVTADTPSLIGLAHSAPYFHDGSARTLEDLMNDQGSVHDMVDRAVLARLTREQIADLVEYLRSL